MKRGYLERDTAGGGGVELLYLSLGLTGDLATDDAGPNVAVLVDHVVGLLGGGLPQPDGGGADGADGGGGLVYGGVVWPAGLVQVGMVWPGGLVHSGVVWSGGLVHGLGVVGGGLVWHRPSHGL